MNNNQVNDYLKFGVYGTKQFQSAMDKNYLGSFRERCYLALTKKQVFQKEYTKEVAKYLKAYADISMLINGSIPLQITKPYIELARMQHKTFTMIQTDLNENSYGLVLIASEAINQSPKLFHL